MVAETRLLEGEGRCAFQGLFDDGRGPRVVSLSGSAFPVHPEPNRPNNKTDEASGDVLSGLPALLVGKFRCLSVIGLDFCSDHRAVGVQVLRLHARDRRWIAARACATKGWGSPLAGETYTRARMLAEQLGRSEYQLPLIHGEWNYHTVQGRHRLAVGYSRNHGDAVARRQAA
jgi:hypothetical protein